MGFYKKLKDEVEELKDEIFHDRVERKAVEELIESVQVLSKHVDGLLEEVVSRDDIVEQLEKTYTKFSQKSREMVEFYTNIIFVFSSCLTISCQFG